MNGRWMAGALYLCLSAACQCFVSVNEDGGVPGDAGASCVDGVRNQQESDVDCGGECVPCAVGQSCGSASDCASMICTNDRCAMVATCANGVKDSAESDVDCGGPACPRCVDGRQCTSGADCVSLGCTNGLCAGAVTCSDGVKNGDESSVDCGGPGCAACGDGATCRANADCVSRNCGSSFICVAVTGSCADGVQNGSEADVDCGGAFCARCAPGARCGAPSDCSTGLCSGGLCVRAPTCSDGLKNGDESDVDCGGPICSRCSQSARCNVNGDCASGRCDDQFLRTDTTWKWSMSGPAGWNTVGFNDSAWSQAVSEGLHGTGPPWGASPPMPPSTQAHWIWSYDSRSSGDFNTLYFRKTFVGPAVPVVLKMAADDRFTAYLDGVQVTSGTIWFTPGVATFTPTPGVTSVLAVTVTNGGGPGGLVGDARLSVPTCAP